ncbi:MAG: hypothetical protein P4N59_16660 [Negativicutes bacterium]|nr:hypothetical protein [Negativicutes bacterium]
MKYRKMRVAICLALVVLLVAALTSTAMAAAHLNWKTVNIYFDDTGKPVIKGYFYNDGTETIDRVNWVQHEIWIRNNGGSFYYLGAATWSNLKVFLRPGESSEMWRLQWGTYQGPVYQFDYWRTEGTINYHVLTGSDS